MPAIYGMPNSMAFRMMGMGGGYGGFGEGNVGAVGRGVSEGVQALMNMLQYNRQMALAQAQIALEQSKVKNETMDTQTRAAQEKNAERQTTGMLLEHGITDDSQNGSSIGAQPQQAAGLSASSPTSFNAGASLFSGLPLGMEAMTRAQNYQPTTSTTRSGIPLDSTQASPELGPQVLRSGGMTYNPASTEPYQQALMQRQSAEGIAARQLAEQENRDTEAARHNRADEGLQGQRIGEEAALRRATLDMQQAFRGDELTRGALTTADNSAPVKNAQGAQQALMRWKEAYGQAMQGNVMGIEPALQQIIPSYDQKARIGQYLQGLHVNPSIQGKITQHFAELSGNPRAMGTQLGQMDQLISGLYSDAATNANQSVARDSAAMTGVNPNVWGAVRGSYAAPTQTSGAMPQVGQKNSQGQTLIPQDHYDEMKTMYPNDPRLKQYAPMGAVGTGPGQQASTGGIPGLPQ